MEELLSLLWWILVDLVLMSVGRVAVRLVSFNAWRGEKLGGREARIHAAAGAFSFVHQERRVITELGLTVAGVIALVVSVLLLVAVFA